MSVNTIGEGEESMGYYSPWTPPWLVVLILVGFVHCFLEIGGGLDCTTQSQALEVGSVVVDLYKLMIQPFPKAGVFLKCLALCGVATNLRNTVARLVSINHRAV